MIPVQQALVLAKGPSNDPNTRARHLSLAESLAGVIFLGTPYAGSGYSFLGKIYCLFHYWDGANPMLLQYLDPGSKETVKLEDDFLKAYPGRSFDYYETIIIFSERVANSERSLGCHARLWHPAWARGEPARYKPLWSEQIQ